MLVRLGEAYGRQRMEQIPGFRFQIPILPHLQLERWQWQNRILILFMPEWERWKCAVIFPLGTEYINPRMRVKPGDIRDWKNPMPLALLQLIRKTRIWFMWQQWERYLARIRRGDCSVQRTG